MFVFGAIVMLAPVASVGRIQSFSPTPIEVVLPNIRMRSQIGEDGLAISGKNVADAMADTATVRHHNARGFTLWGAVRTRAFRGLPNQRYLSRFDGEDYQAQLGGGYFNHQHAYGVMVIAAGTQLDMQSPAEGAVDARVEMIQVSPYVSAVLRGGTEVWGRFGLGRGRMRYSAFVGTNNQVEWTDVTFKMVGGGLSQPLYRLGQGALSLKIDAYHVTTTAEARVEVFNKLRANNTRARLLLEATSNRSGAQTPWVFAVRSGSRYETGAGPAGFGFEADGVISYKNQSNGLGVSLSLGVLFLHTDQDYRHLNAGVTVSVDLGIKGP